MLHYEARFLPPEEPAPDSPDEPLSSDDADALQLVANLQQWAELQIGREGDAVILPEVAAQALLADIAVGHSVEKLVDSFDAYTPEIIRSVTQAGINRSVWARKELEIQAISVGANVAAACLHGPRRLHGALVDNLADNLLEPLSAEAALDPESVVLTGVEGALAALKQRLQAISPSASRDQERHVNQLLFVGAHQAIYGPPMDSENQDDADHPVSEPERISWQDVTFWPATLSPEDRIEEEYAYEQDDDLVPFGLSEMYPDPDTPDMFSDVEVRISPVDLGKFTNFLKLDQRLVLFGRSGFAVPELGLDGLERPRFSVLTQKLNAIFGKDTYYPQRVNGIYNEAATKIRIRGRGASILGALEAFDVDTTADRLWVGDSLRTGRSIARKTATEMEHDQSSEAPETGWWSALEGSEALVARVGASNFQERGTEAYALVSSVLLEGMKAVASTLLTPQAEILRTPYPKAAYEELRERIGSYLTAELLEDVWNANAEQLLTQKHKGSGQPRINPNRFGQLFSRLLADCIQEEDVVHLQIPSSFGGRCGYLGAWAPRGKIIIEGHAGAHTGHHISGSAHVVVDGKTGPYSGYGARDNSIFERAPERQQEQPDPPAEKHAMPQEVQVFPDRKIHQELKDIERSRDKSILLIDEAAEALQLTEEELVGYMEEMGLGGHAGLTPREFSKLLRHSSEIRRRLGLE